MNLQAFQAGSFRESMSKKAWGELLSILRAGGRGLQGRGGGLSEQQEPCEAGSVDASKSLKPLEASIEAVRNEDAVATSLARPDLSGFDAEQAGAWSFGFTWL